MLREPALTVSLLVCLQLRTPGIQDTLREVTQIIGREAAAAGGQRGVLVVCGTGYIMPEARTFLGIAEPR
jgi:hypothetical protein